jgi:hypothetical protein
MQTNSSAYFFTRKRVISKPKVATAGLRNLSPTAGKAENAQPFYF